MIDYLAYQQGLKSPLQSLANAFVPKAEREAAALQLQQDQQKMNRQKEMQGALAKLTGLDSKNPQLRIQAINETLLKFPELQENLSGIKKGFTEELNNQRLKRAFNIKAASQVGKGNTITLLERYRDEASSSGSKEDEDFYNLMLNQANQDIKGIEALSDLFIASNMPMEKRVEAYQKLEQVQRDEERQAGFLAKQAIRKRYLEALSAKSAKTCCQVFKNRRK